MKEVPRTELSPRQGLRPPGWVRTIGKLKAWLLLLMLAWIVPQRAVAQDITDGQISFEDKLNSGGYVQVKFPIYNDDGNDEGLHVGKASGIFINDTKIVELHSFSGDGDPQGEDNWYWAKAKKINPESVAYLETQPTRKGTAFEPVTETEQRFDYARENETTSWATFRVYPSVSELKKGNITVKVYLYVDKNEGSNYETSKYNTFSFTAPTTPTLSVDFSQTPGYQSVSFSGTTGDKYKITDGSETKINETGAVKTDYAVRNSQRTVNLTYYKKISEWQYYDLSASTVIPAYEHPNDFKVEQQSDGNVKISWSIPTYNGSKVTGGNFEIQRSKDQGFATSETVATLAFTGAKSYSFVDEVSKLNLNGTYYYRLRRTNAAAWNWSYVKTASITLSMAHSKIASANAEITEEGKVKITWAYDGGNVWSENSEVMVERTNVTKSTSTTYSIASSKTTTTYEEELPTTCDVYTYKIYVKPGLSVYSAQSGILVQSEGNLYSVEMGSVTSFAASKGYHGDRISLEWETDGKAIDLFSVRAREYGSDDEWKQIDQVEANVASTTYQYSDTKSVPGVVYEYQVVAITACGGENVQKPYDKTEIGFRTPTGDVYGRVTFESGQAVPDVEVRAEVAEGSGIGGKAYVLDAAADKLTVGNTSLLKEATAAATLEAWVRPTGEGTIIEKAGMYRLAYTGGKIEFVVGTQAVSTTKTVSEYIGAASYIHVAAVAASDYIYIYVNGAEETKEARTATVTGNDNQVVMGGFTGAIDEVRLWTVARTAEEVARDYGRYLVGNETGLAAYYTFDYSVAGNFFDTSYSGSNYNQNHGVVSGAELSATDIPTTAQLGYKGYTSADGAYNIRALPYTGNGTSYMIIPRLGIHQFESEKELRLLNGQAQSHTVNFTDKSSFRVSGKVMYKGGNVPVEGVMFNVDGVTAMDGKGNILQTDAQGMFEISVPVGQHEVKAVKANHVFEQDGRITDSNGQDRNYQDLLTGLELYDVTTVRYVGRVAGGAVQEAFPVGHSLSKNNLGDGISVTLTYQNDSYVMTNDAANPLQAGTREETPVHFKSGYDNKVVYNGNTITIYPNAKTGEFVADVIPETYKVTVTAAGHGEMPENNSQLSLNNSFTEEYSTNEYTDEATGKTVIDTVRYNKKQLFIKRYTPTIDVKQLENGKELPYFGKKEMKITTMVYDDSYTVPFWNETTGYTFGMPVYEQSDSVTYSIRVFEEYIYKDGEGKNKADVAPDRVPTEDAKLSFTLAELPAGVQNDITVDENGYATYGFRVNQMEPTAAKRKMAITMTYGSEDSPTSVNWAGGFDAVVIGYRMSGTSFITAGPDKVLFVLRDPPGSNSYAYLEKGTTITEENSYTGSVTNEGEDFVTLKANVKLTTFAGIGAGTITDNDFRNEVNVGLVHSEVVGGTDRTTKTTTTTTRFQTSADPLYVGADGDLYVGYSTNISLGKTENVSVVPKATYQGNPAAYQVFEDITPVATSDYLLVKTDGVGMSQKYATLFAYPQIHIEKVLIPQMVEYRNSLLHQQTENIDFQALADQQGKAVYVSKLLPTHANYGKSNSDKVFEQGTDIYDGKSYKIYFPKTSVVKMQNDTILALNQSIDNWYKHLKQNEMDKVKATLLQNYSYQAGSSIEYAESYSHEFSATTNFSLCIGQSVAATFGVTINTSGYMMNVNEVLKTEHGGEFTDVETASQSKGFVLEDSGADYLSVDVCRPSGWAEDDEYIEYDDINSDSQHFSTFIFKTKGGATSCPYEGGTKTKYYEPGVHTIDEATAQIEVPEISVETSFVENVPSGKPAYFTLYIRNNSEVLEDNWFDLKLDDASNPNGAQLYMDGAPIGNGRALLVPAGETLTKTLEVRKGSVMNYDNLRLRLQSQCQCDPTDSAEDILDDVTFTVHFTPSATDVNIKKPSNNWTYNTALPTESVNGVEKHYMTVQLDEFDVNYDNFYRIKLQYKPASGSDDDWTTLMNYYNDRALYDQAVANGQNATMIDAADAGTITYKWFLDDLQDQNYDLRAVGTSMINNVEYENASEVYTGVKDMYNPRLFGSAQPANGVLTINDEIRLNFNETIAEGYLTDNNFQVTGVRNGAQTDHAVSVYLDGKNDVLTSEFARNWGNKDLTIEMWVLADKAQNAVFFSQGNVNEAIELAITADNRLKVKVGNKEITSKDAVAYEQGTWAHVALVYDKTGKVSAYYNYVEYISNVETPTYAGEGTYQFGGDIKGGNLFAGKMHNARIWDKVQTSGRLQTNSLTLLSGAESNLLAYYPMNEAKGTVLKDKARGVNLAMNGSEWALPEGRAVAFNGTDQYVKLSTASAVVDYLMDYTIEFWFKGAAGQKNATLAANGRGDGEDLGGSRDLFFLGFEEGVLTFRNNGVKATAEGNYLDDNWHHIALTVSRTNGRGQILIDGALRSYFESQDLGGVAAAYIYLGARSWFAKDNAQTENVDCFFKGEIDEFRLWNLYKNETLVESGSTEGLDGTEMGLMAYYPFQHYIEWQGTKELQFTLKDMRVVEDPTKVAADAVAVGGEVETSQAAPIRDKGPVSKLSYNFVVNNDALIITLDETWDRIEKTTVTFTVDGVRDLNGNKLLNPITWSAYIDRNQLKWGESDITIQKDLNAEKSFTVKAVNNGGSVQHFTLENMPSWLDVEPESGTINPLASLDITFTIDAGLNVGSYDEVVYMRNDNNVVEALPISVKVNAEKPDWSVNPADFQYSMSVFGKLLIDNIYSMDEEDMLAVFSKGTCVGVVNNSYSKANDMYYALLSVYSNTLQGDALEFRIWDASTGVTYQATPDREIVFSNNDIVGSATNPVIFTAEEICVQHIALQSGWNWISVNVETEKLNDLNDLLANNTWSSSDLVKNEQGTSASYSKKSGWNGTLTGLNNSLMYLVHSSKTQTLDVTGTLVDPTETKLNISGTLNGGTKTWNYISYLPSVNLPLKEALAGYEAVEGDVIKSQSGFAMYSGNVGWIGSLSYMESGKGYMLQRNASTAATLQYPSTATTRSALTRSEESLPEVEKLFVNNNYADNMTVVARLTGVDVTAGDKLMAYVNGELRGEAPLTIVPESDSALFFLTVAGDKTETVDVVLQSNGDVKASAKAVMAYGSNQVKGSIAAPMLIDMQSLSSNVSIFPSPFTDVLNIRMAVDADAKVDVLITNVQGMTVGRLRDCNDNGIVNVSWKDASRLTSGVYVVAITVNGTTSSYKVVKK